MLTYNFKIEFENKEDEDFLIYFLDECNVSFRKIYQNIGDVEGKKEMERFVTEKHLRSSKLCEYIFAAVDTKHQQDESNRMNKLKEIEDLKNKIKKGNKLSRVELKRIQRRITRLDKQVNTGITFGGKELLRKIKLYDDLLKNWKDRDRKKYRHGKGWYKRRLTELRQEFKDKRRACVTIKGETSRKGNRFFDFRDLDKGIIIFKPENWKRKIKLRFNAESLSDDRKKVLKILSTMALNKDISLTVSLDSKYLHLSFEEGKLNGTFFDKKTVAKEAKKLPQEERKEHHRKAHQEHDERMAMDKVRNRYAGIDINPKGIGLTIADKLSEDPDGDFVIVKKVFYDLSELTEKGVTSEKRRFEISNLFSRLFDDLYHHKVCHFIVEDISKINGDKGSRETNRLINNVWCRLLIHHLCTKWCKHHGIRLDDVNPAYSSFVGNILYDEYDPVAASIEIVRRGMVKYIKGRELWPSFHNGLVNEAILRAIRGSAKMYDEKMLTFKSWIEVWRFAKSEGLSVRRVIVNDHDHELKLQENIKKSKVKYLTFV